MFTRSRKAAHQKEVSSRNYGSASACTSRGWRCALITPDLTAVSAGCSRAPSARRLANMAGWRRNDCKYANLRAPWSRYAPDCQKLAIEMPPVSSLTIRARQSVSSVMPIPGAMAGSHFGGEQRIHAERKKTGGWPRCVLLNNDGAVVERGTRMKDRQQKSREICGVEGDAAFDKSAQADVAFQHDESSHFIPRHGGESQQNFIGRFRPLVAAEEPASAEPGQGAADLGLEQHNNGDGRIGRQR